MRTAELDFVLPDELIATTPAEPRDSARLLVAYRDTGRLEHHRVRDLPQLGIFQPGDLMVLNQTQVLPAYLRGRRAATGGKITGLFVQEINTGLWLVMLESGGRLIEGDQIELYEKDSETAVAHLHLLQSEERGQWLVNVQADGPLDPPLLLGRVGRPPLPPYLRRARKSRGEPMFLESDLARYSTVFEEKNTPSRGSVAAPTAGLHLTAELLNALAEIGVKRTAVNLQVGLGTFLPVKSDILEDHPIHQEWIDVPPATVSALREARADGRKILAVGTTAVRTIETLPHPLSVVGFHRGNTSLFITPDRVADGSFTWRLTDRLLTNFHLPKSTLLAMVAALPGVGLPRLLDWYRQAIAHGYRFYSFGDAMLIV